MSSIFYKYRALDPWEYFLDVLVNERLHSATFGALNDPMEGMFTYAKDQESPGFIRKIVEQKTRLRICSLSRTYNSTVMWSYYAAAHHGVVLGVDIDLNHRDVMKVAKVTYAQKISFQGFAGSDAETEARKILSKKLSAWRHEQEVRVFSHKKFVSVHLRQVFLGCQMPSTQQKLIKRLLHRMASDVEVKLMKRSDLDTQGLPDAI